MDFDGIEGFIEVRGRYPLLVTAVHGFGSDGYRLVVQILRKCLKMCGYLKTFYTYHELKNIVPYHSAVDVYTWEIAYKTAVAEELWAILPTLSKIDRIEGIYMQDYNLNKSYAILTPFWKRVEEVIREGGIKIVIDIHGMKNIKKWPDICISSRGYRTASKELVKMVANYFKEQGFSVAIDHPFSGGAFIAEFGRPPEVEAIAIEIKRSLRFYRSRIPGIIGGAIKMLKKHYLKLQ